MIKNSTVLFFVLLNLSFELFINGEVDKLQQRVVPALDKEACPAVLNMPTRGTLGRKIQYAIFSRSL